MGAGGPPAEVSEVGASSPPSTAVTVLLWWVRGCRPDPRKRGEAEVEKARRPNDG
jgi:hypothetical protein